ncbi:MAG TPA: AsmA family protein [Noviherbaspirillum sp.]
MSRGTTIAIWSAAVLSGLLVVGCVFLATFDWNRAKPWISQRVSESTGRPFVIHGDLSLAWQAPQGESGWRAWIPWPRLSARQVSIGNPDWAATPIMAEAQHVVFSLSPLPLLRKTLVIPSLALEAPRLQLLRLEDGRNNWTLPTPNDAQSAWNIDIQRLILNRGSLHLADAVRQTRLEADIDTLGHRDGDEVYRIGWRVAGVFNGEPVSGNGRAGNVLSLRERDVRFPIDASLRIGKIALHAIGTLTHPVRPTAVELNLKVQGVTMAHLYPVIRVVFPETRPFVVEGKLTGKPGPFGGEWTYDNFKGKVGTSDLSGKLQFRGREHRGTLEGTVVSDYLNFNDLSPLVGADSDLSRAERGVRVRQPEGKMLPVEKFRAERWTSIDADVQFSGRKVVRRKTLPVYNVVAHIRLDAGVLSLAPLKFGMAGGNVVSNIRLDGNTDPVNGEIRLSARHLKLKELFPSLATLQANPGEINGDAALRGAGNSIAALLATSHGEVKAVLNEGAISKLALESMGMNLGSMLTTQLFGDKPVRIHCAASDFQVRHGIMQTRAFVIDTADAILHLDGRIDLAQEKIGLMLYPESKGLRLISLRSPVRVRGSFTQLSMEVDKEALVVKAGSALALGILAPVAAALVPLVNVGPGEKSPCGSLLAQATEKPAMPKPRTASRPRKTTEQLSGN